MLDDMRVEALGDDPRDACSATEVQAATQRACCAPSNYCQAGPQRGARASAGSPGWQRRARFWGRSGRLGLGNFRLASLNDRRYFFAAYAPLFARISSRRARWPVLLHAVPPYQRLSHANNSRERSVVRFLLVWILFFTRSFP